MPRGKLRIYLGAAPGVGKTFAMLNEGRRRLARGTDVVVGLVETHGRANTAAQVGDLEVVPRRKLVHRGREFEEMDTDAVIERRPQVVLIDELAHTNVPGSRHEKRWQDIDEILDAGIDVVSTLNIQHLESVNDVVEQITGVTQHETIPDAVVRAAEQVELADMTPEALRRRMAHGNIYPAERVDAALANYFRPGNLAALRELALLWVADRVDASLQQYMEDHGIEATWETRERVVVALTGAANGEHLIRRAARMAQRTRGELLGVHVRATDGLAGPPPGLLAEHRVLLEQLGGAYREVVGDDIGTALVQFARAEHATQLVLGATRRSRWTEIVRGSVIARAIRQSGPIDVHVISSEGVDAGAHLALPHPRVSLSRRRQWVAWALVAVGLPVLTVAMAGLRDHMGLPSHLLLYLTLVVVVAAVGGLRPALVAGAGSFLLANWYFTPPLHGITIAEAEDVLALIVFLVVGVVVSTLVTTAARRSAEAVRAKAEAEALARFSGTVLGQDDPLGLLMIDLRTAFDVDACAVLRREGDGWQVESSAGEPVPTRPEDGQLTVPLDEDEQLVLVGPHLDNEDMNLLRAFTAQLAVALERRQLRAEAAMASGLAEANELRTALLAAVSHDLRTPLSSIKASVTSLLQDDVRWTADATREFLLTIDEESDRLNALVGNLLDMSRLQTGALRLVVRDVGLEEVVPRAVAGIAEPAGRLELAIPETLPRVRVDAALLERAVANLLDNALAAEPSEGPVRVDACAADDHVDLRIVDRGPGVPRDQRDRMFQPFQRLGDQPNGSGVGLGLAVARGFVEAMHGEVVVEDTPGGGLTMVLRLPAVTR
jgi:two-component system, OmpR family, sensor histidine kinase KdpD